MPPAAPPAATPLRTPARYSWELSVLRKIRDKLRARACDGSSRWAADLARIQVELACLERTNALAGLTAAGGRDLARHTAAGDLARVGHPSAL